MKNPLGHRPVLHIWAAMLAGVVFSLGVAAGGSDVPAPQIKYEKFTLKNGLEVILAENHRLPLVAVDLWYHVGPANERAGRTGFAHLFEHMMFEGSQHVAAKEHDRCGSHLVAPLLSSTVAGTVAARRAGLRGPAVDGAIALGSMAIAVEIFGWSERHAGTALARALRRPGYEIQRIVGTREPDERQLEVGRAAMEEILRVEA